MIAQEIRCLLGTFQKNGRTISQYMFKDGSRMTEVVSKLGENVQGYRQMYADSSGIVNKVIDSIPAWGRSAEVYTRGLGGELMQESKGVVSKMSGSWDSFVQKCMNLIA